MRVRKGEDDMDIKEGDNKKYVISLAQRFVCSGCQTHCHINAENYPPTGICVFTGGQFGAVKWHKINHENIVDI